jgi:membrane protease YdiL (CAAX protease family)
LAATLFSLVLLGILTLSLTLWLKTIRRWWRGETILPTNEASALQPWGGIDLLFAFLTWISLQYLAVQLSGPLGLQPIADGSGRITIQGMTWIQLFSCYSLIVTTAFIALRCRIPIEAVGWSLAHWKNDLRLGLTAYVMLTPVIYLVMFLATALSKVPYEHPLFDETRKDIGYLVPAFMLAVLAAPFFEEFVFRVLFQGFLESIAAGGIRGRNLWLGRAASSPAEIADFAKDQGSQLRPEAVPGVEISGFGFPVELSEVALSDRNAAAAEGSPQTSSRSTPQAWWPVIVSGLVFGLFHYSYGISWIPLSILGIALGWLYRITHRIWPGLIVHFCLNAVSMSMFALHVIYKLPISH